MILNGIYQNNELSINNGQDYCKILDTNTAYEFIKKNFNQSNYVSRKKVNIKTNNNSYTTTIIGKTSSKLITIDNKLINIKDIIYIKEIS